MGAIVEVALMPWARRMKDKVNLPIRLYWRDGGTPLDLGHFERPAVTIRVKDASGLPLGLQILAPALEEERMFALAAAIEKAAKFAAKPGKWW